MTTRFSPPSFYALPWAICLTFLLNASAVFAADHLGPVFPRNTVVEVELDEPLPLPRNNALLQRPQTRQVVFDDLDVVGTIVPQHLFHEEDFGIQPQIIRQRQPSPRMAPVIETDNAIFTNNSFMDTTEIIRSRIISDLPFGMSSTCGVDTFSCSTSTIPVPYGMGLLDNITLFGETTTLKTGLCNGGGSFGLAQGINWSAALTPQGAVTGQYGVRTVQAEFNSHPTRHQLFMTAALFKRFDFARLQTGVAVDWLQDRTQYFGTVKLQQMRCEVSTRIFRSLECGFIGGFSVFPNRRDIWEVADVHDYYLFFVRKHLPNGGQLELRGGSSAHGDFIIHTLGEVAISDRLAVNGGLSVLTPSGGTSYGPRGAYRERWSMSMGVVLYFRGGAIFRQANSHRPMFNVAGNDSFLTRSMY